MKITYHICSPQGAEVKRRSEDEARKVYMRFVSMYGYAQVFAEDENGTSYQDLANKVKERK